MHARSRTRPVWGYLLALCLLAAGCTPDTPGTTAMSSSVTGKDAVPGKSDQGAQKHLHRLNPQPRQGYEITYRVEGAPGPFEDTGAFGNYVTQGCHFVTNAWAGATATPSRQIPIEVRRIDDRTYSATVYLDAMLDEDYYGNGVCRWQLLDVSAGFSTLPDGKANIFGVSYGPEAITAGEAVTKHYHVEDYPPDGPRGGGMGLHTSLVEQARAEGKALFSITATARPLP